jgi:hypothetical protein
MKHLRNERGMALATALMLTLLSLALILAVLYYLTQATQQSAASKRYKNVLEATGGGAEFFSKELLPQIFTGTSTGDLLNNVNYQQIGLSFGAYSSCLKQKINNSTANWNTTLCGGAATKINDPKVAPDVTFKLNALPSQPKFQVFAKVVDTVAGNSDTSGYSNGMLDSGSGVAYAGSTGSSIAPMHVPALLTIEVHGERETNPKEKARLSVVYSY